jgi:hypothetical protein
VRVWARSLIVGALVSLTSTANADWYSCKDSQGKRQGGDSPPAECKGEICVTKSNGDRKCTPPPETPEQRKKREQQEKRQHECEKKALDKFHDDFGFIDKYKTANDIQEERNRSIAEQQRRIDDAKQRLKVGKDRKAKLDEKAQFFEKHPMPEDLRRDIESNRKLLDQQERDLASLLGEMQRIIEKYDAMVRRREDLGQNGIRPVPCDPEK